MIKNLLSVLILFILFTAGSVSGGNTAGRLDFSFILIGKVYDDSTGAPIKNHEVNVSSDEGYSKTLLTDDNGNYADTISGLINPQSLIHVSTKDCHNVVHSQSVEAGNHSAVINFSICGESNPQPKYNIGGLVFAGLYPINNPVSTGDTGVAQLFRIEGKKIIPWDAKIFTEYGYYSFLHLIPGQYFVKIFLTPGSQHYGGFIPSYHNNALYWNSSQIVNVVNEDLFNIDVHLMQKSGIMNGNGHISGLVVMSGARDEGEPVAGAEVVLSSVDGTPVDYTFTDQYGNYSFGSVPSGNYRLFIDYPGKYSVYTDLTLSETNPSAENLDLELFNDNPNGIADIPVTDLAIGTIFPNPAGDMIHLRTNSPVRTVISAEIINQAGISIRHEEGMIQEGNAVLAVRTGSPAPGMYLLIVRDSEGKILKTEKFLRK